MAERFGQSGQIRVRWEIIVVVVGWVVSMVLAYSAVDARVRILEDRYERLFSDVREIKGDVKQLLERAE